MEFYAVKKLGVIRPLDPADAELMGKMREGEAYRVKVSMPRNIRFHRKFRALLSIVYDNLQEVIPARTPDGEPIQIRSIEDLHWHIKMQVGYYEKKVTLGGRITYEAKSTRFSAMDEAQFQEYYDRAVDVILKYFLPETNREELEEIILMTFG